MTRRSIELLRIAEWPRLDEQALNKHVLENYRSRCAALEAYAQGEPVASMANSAQPAKNVKLA